MNSIAVTAMLGLFYRSGKVEIGFVLHASWVRTAGKFEEDRYDDGLSRGC